MSKIKVFSIICALLFLFPAVYASSFNVKVAPLKDKIAVNDVAEFNITIQNNLQTEEEFTIKKAGYPFWDMYTNPLQNPLTLKVPASSAASITLLVQPLHEILVNTYSLDVGILLERLSEEQKVPITVGITSTEPLISGYIPTVLTSTSISPEKIDPREKFTIKIVLNNQNVLNYSNLTIKVESSLFMDELHVPLGPREDKTIELVKKLDDMAPPEQDSFSVSIFKDERMIVTPIVKELEVKEYSAQEELPKEESFLKIKRGIKVTSNNPDYLAAVKIKLTPFKNLFLTSSPKGEIIKEDEVRYLVWNAKLGENRTVIFYTFENYRPIVVIIAGIIIAIVLYFLFRSPIIVRKSIANFAMSEGGISEAKVVIRLKNRSREQITNIEVVDSLPNIAHVEKEVSIGSMQPHAVLAHPKKGMMIKWAIESLEPGDERMLSYKMKSRLPILGEFNLSSATARCKHGNKLVISNSNRVSVGS